MVEAVDIAEAVRRFDSTRTALEFWKQEELIVLPEFLPPETVDLIRQQVDRSQDRVVRRRVFNYKRSGSISYHTIRDRVEAVGSLYESRPLIQFLSRLADLPLITCGVEDPHSCAIYQYEHEGDHVGFHYDTSWYAGARYTVLIGLVDAPGVRLHCRLHSRDPHRPSKELEVSTRPGTLVFFNGDKLLHRVTPLGAGERRVVLTMQYVTTREMHPIKRAISNLKDALTYFGFGELRQRPKLLPSDVTRNA